MGTVLIEISWPSSGRAVRRISVESASAQALPHRARGPGTVMGDLARDMRKAFKKEYPLRRPDRHRLSGSPTPSLARCARHRNLAVLKTGPDREPLAGNHRKVAPRLAPEQPS